MYPILRANLHPFSNCEACVFAGDKKRIHTSKEEKTEEYDFINKTGEYDYIYNGLWKTK